MREIKFRAWHLIENRWAMEYEIENTILVNTFYHGGRFELDEKSGNGLAKDLGTTLEVMQYTGLKDKNGKEIYEGDIIKNHTPKGENHSAYDEIGVVIWDKTRIIAEQKKYGKYFSIVEGHSEVIGNIYANPELLEVTP